MTTIIQLSAAFNAEREQTKTSVADLAERAGVARAALYRFLKGSDICMSTFVALADTLDLDIVLAPKAVSSSLLASTGSNPTVTPNVAGQSQSGPRSAVEARLDNIKSWLHKGKS